MSPTFMATITNRGQDAHLNKPPPSSNLPSPPPFSRLIKSSPLPCPLRIKNQCRKTFPLHRLRRTDQCLPKTYSVPQRASSTQYQRALNETPPQHARAVSAPYKVARYNSTPTFQPIQHPWRPVFRETHDNIQAILEASRRHRSELHELEKAALQKAAQDEAERQARLKAEKQTAMAEYLEEERLRKLHLQDELRRAALAKERKEELERQEEEESKRTIEENRRAAREKWLHESFRRQEWRSQQDALNKDLQSNKVEMRKRQQQARRSRPLSTQGRTEVFSGWVSVQKDVLPFMKRRYCRVRKLEILLTSTDMASAPVIERIALTDVDKVREAADGYEELEGLPHAFALDLRGGETSYTLLADSADQKEDLISAVIQLADL